MSNKKSKRRTQIFKPYYIRPKTNGQELYEEALEDDSIRYLAVSGPSGSGKTLFACRQAARALNNGQTVYISRSVTPIKKEELGFTPGSVDDKMADWLLPITEHLKKFVPNVSELVQSGRIKSLPLATVRGRSLENCFVLVTEAQNLSFETIKCLLTRIDFRSKLVLDGDFCQNDTRKVQTDFQRVTDKLIPLESFDHIALYGEDVVRSKDIVEILELLEGME
jgi:phosphate starvation-inducible PhoH-like protein